MKLLLSNKWNKTLTHATTWRNPENIKLKKKPVTEDHILY